MSSDVVVVVVVVVAAAAAAAAAAAIDCIDEHEGSDEGSEWTPNCSRSASCETTPNREMSHAEGRGDGAVVVSALRE
jgi:hypothetical protein